MILKAWLKLARESAPGEGGVLDLGGGDIEFRSEGVERGKEAIGDAPAGVRGEDPAPDLPALFPFRPWKIVDVADATEEGGVNVPLVFIKTDLGRANQLGDGAPLVWLY